MAFRDSIEVVSEVELTGLPEKFFEEEFRNEDHTYLFRSLSSELERVAEMKNGGTQRLKNIFRVLRNCCIQCEKNQNVLLKTDIPSIVLRLLSETTLLSEYCNVTISCGLQFIGNFSAGNVEVQNYVFKYGFPNLFTCHLVENHLPLDENRFKICSMILYNCLNECHVRSILTSQAGLLILKSLCEALDLFSQLDWVVLSVSDHFLKDSQFISFVMSNCSVLAQHHVLGIYCDFMEGASGNEVKISSNHVSSVICLVNCFLQRFQSLENEFLTNDVMLTVAMMLRALCWMTADIPLSQCTGKADFIELVCVVVELLTDIMKLGENSSEQITENKRALINHLNCSFGKRNLVRLIGNLCYNNLAIQNQVRSLRGISLILQACVIDDDNPFMQQWAIFAIRNLCQNNPLNQTEIAKLEKLAVADSPVLKSMGLTVSLDENGKPRVICSGPQ